MLQNAAASSASFLTKNEIFYRILRGSVAHHCLSSSSLMMEKTSGSAWCRVLSPSGNTAVKFCCAIFAFLLLLVVALLHKIE